jgi:precorrin-2/cobalt-factor-2 C20-methyltransferase
MAGILYGVGVGPGDPDLLTLKAVKVIQQADVIIAPKTEKKDDSLALSIARPFVRPDAEIVKLVFPMVKDGEELSQAWQDNKEVMQALLRQGKKVVFLTLGDPMIYSTYIYVYQLLKDCGCLIETVPGIPSFCAIGSRLGYPVVEGEQVLNIVPATLADRDLDQSLSTADSVVLMKVYRNFPRVVEQLKKHGLLKKAVMVSNCGLPEEQISRDLETMDAEKPLKYLSTIISKR